MRQLKDLQESGGDIPLILPTHNHLIMNIVLFFPI
jgi:hypothetical protein